MPVINSHKESRDLDPTKYDNILSILQQASNQKRKFSILNTDTGNTDDVDKPGRQKSHGYRKKDLITLLENDVGMFNIPNINQMLIL